MVNPEDPKSTDTHDQVAEELLRLFHRNIPVSQAMTLFTGAIMAVVLWSVTESQPLMVWMVFVILGSSFRLVLSLRFKQTLLNEKRVRQITWERLTRLSTLSSGLIWGLGGVFLYPVGDPARETFVCLILLGMCSGAMPLQAPVRHAYALFCGSILIPIAVLFFNKGEIVYFFLAVTALLQFYALVVSAGRYRKNIAESQRLRFDNEALVQDLTESKEAALSAKQEADLANQSKSEFLANMSHEIRTPMNAILGLTQLAMGSTPDRKQDYLGKIGNSAELLLSLLNDILDFSKIEAGKVSIEKVGFDLKEVVDWLDNAIGSQAWQKNLDFSITMAQESPRYLIGDPHRLSQVLINILSNAIKFTDKGSVEMKIESFEGEKDQVKLRFAVKDTGIGLSDEQRNRVFQAFSQADTSTTRKFGGTGLGLAICWRLAELMNGDVGVESTYGQGSTFSFTVPFMRFEGRIDSIKSISKSLHVSTRIEHGRLNGIHVLVAEDNKVNQQVIQELLEKAGAKVSMVDNGQGVIESVSKNHFHAVLMDIQMPLMDGLQATRELRARSEFADLPIIALTANVYQADIDTCLAAGMNDHIGKPVRLDELYSKLNKWIDLPKPQTVAGPGARNDQIKEPESVYAPIDGECRAPGLDTAAALGLLGGDSVLYKQVLYMFHKNEADSAESVRSALAAGDLELCQRQAHTLKSSAGAIGANRIQAAALAIELACRKGDIPEDDLIKELEAAHKEVMDGLESYERCEEEKETNIDMS